MNKRLWIKRAALGILGLFSLWGLATLSAECGGKGGVLADTGAGILQCVQPGAVIVGPRR